MASLNELGFSGRRDLEDFGGCHAFRESQARRDNQRAPQRNREEHAEQAADRRNRGGLPVVEGGPIANEQQRRNREDHAGGQRFARGGGRLDDVVLENVGPFEEAKNRHRGDRGRNGRGHGHAGEETKVSVGGGQNCREDYRQDDRFDGDFRKRDCGGDDGLVVVCQH